MTQPPAFSFKAIGIVHSCYKEKFAIPRQPGLVDAAQATLEMYEEFSSPDCFRGLEGFSHIWLTFVFHEHLCKGWRPLVRPPRLNGKRLGVFSTRATFRPNPIGISVVRLQYIEYKNRQAFLHLAGIDLLDQTPVIDIKPYVPYTDRLEDARQGFVEQIEEQAFTVSYSDYALHQIKQAETTYPFIHQLVEQMLTLDPRPVYTKGIKDIYVVKIYEFDLKWRIEGQFVEVISLERVES